MMSAIPHYGSLVTYHEYGIIRRMSLKRRLAVALLFLSACSARQPEQISVNLVADGRTRALATDTRTVGAFLRQAGITLGDLDRVRPNENASLQDGATVTVVRVVQTTETITETIPFETQRLPDASIPPGAPLIIQAGRNGERQITYRITLEDEVEVRRERIEDKEITPPVAEIVRVGIRDAFSTVPFTGTIAFVSNNNAFVMRGTPSGRRAVTTAGDLDGLVFDLSPDGRWLIYTRAISASLNELWIVETVLATPEARALELTGVLWAGWSPDGASIAYSTAEPSTGPAPWRARNDLFTLPIDDGRPGRARQVLTENNSATYAWWGTTFAWAPDGEALAFADSDGVGIVDLTAETPEPTRLAAFTPFNTRSTWAWVPTPAWSSDGQFIAFTLHGKSQTGRSDEDSERFDVYAVSRDGATQVRLFGPAGMWSEPIGSGSLIALGQPEQPFESDQSRYDLLLLDRDGSNRRIVFPPEGELGLPGRPDLAWSPDGAQLVFAYQTGREAYQGDLYLVDAIAGTVQQLTTDGTLRSPRWSR
ncbi:MAG TPA: G5 domain-containing protein [Anaerolineae bacterium]|nr:G5 domain-containing protein [Anaerolineae bacterium]